MSATGKPEDSGESRQPSSTLKVSCRKRSVKACYDGQPASSIYEEGDPANDGTYDPLTKTVVCDACYIGF